MLRTKEKNQGEGGLESLQCSASGCDFFSPLVFCQKEKLACERKQRKVQGKVAFERKWIRVVKTRREGFVRQLALWLLRERERESVGAACAIRQGWSREGEAWSKPTGAYPKCVRASRDLASID